MPLHVVFSCPHRRYAPIYASVFSSSRLSRLLRRRPLLYGIDLNRTIGTKRWLVCHALWVFKTFFSALHRPFTPAIATFFCYNNFPAATASLSATTVFSAFFCYHCFFKCYRSSVSNTTIKFATAVSLHMSMAIDTIPTRFTALGETRTICKLS